MPGLSPLKERLMSKTWDFFQAAISQLLKRKGLVLEITGVLLAVLVLLSLSGVPVFSSAEDGKTILTLNDFSDLPRDVIREAELLAEQYYGRSQEANLYVQQLLAAYLESRDKDFLIIFNAGGWGTSGIERAYDWQSVLNGIESNLRKSGYKVSSLNYRRTNTSFLGKVNELKEIVTGYVSKARELAGRVQFLTQQNRDLKIILAGESNGTMICDSAMNILRDNNQVYSIQTGVPFWQRNTIEKRTVMVNHNGLTPDSFSRGDLFTILISNIKAVLRGEVPPDVGTTLGVVSAPGHKYSWDYPGVCSQIENFLEKNFNIQTINSY
jgi:hypothetical protein